MSYEPKLAAALSGATIRQLSHWRTGADTGGAILVPELSAERPLLYSFRDVVALRTCVKLRSATSLQKIRKALDTLRRGLGEEGHLSSYSLVVQDGGKVIYLVDPDEAVDLTGTPGNIVIHQMVDVLRPFYLDGGRRIPDRYEPRPHLRVSPEVRGGAPVILGTRIPSAEVAALMRDGVSPVGVAAFYSDVSEEAAMDAQDFEAYVDSYGQRRDAA